MDISNSNLSNILGAGSEYCNLPLAMAYVPMQPWETPYEPDVALRRATIFPSLDLPFLGEEAVNNANRY